MCFITLKVIPWLWNENCDFMVDNLVNANKKNNRLSLQFIAHRKDYDIWRWKSRSWLGTGTTHVVQLNRLLGSQPSLLDVSFLFFLLIKVWLKYFRFPNSDQYACLVCSFRVWHECTRHKLKKHIWFLVTCFIFRSFFSMYQSYSENATPTVELLSKNSW